VSLSMWMYAAHITPKHTWIHAYVCTECLQERTHRASVYGVESWGTVVTSRKPGSISRHAITTLDSPSSLVSLSHSLFYPSFSILETLVCLFFPSAIYPAARRVNGPTGISSTNANELVRTRFFLPLYAAKRSLTSVTTSRKHDELVFSGTIRAFRKVMINSWCNRNGKKVHNWDK